MMNPTLRKVTACVCYTALIVISLGLIFGPLVCFSQVAGRPASETYVAAKLNAHDSTNNAHADIRAQVFAATTNVNALTITATNATEAAHAATVQANAAILKNTQQDADISYLYASNANTIAIANLANTRAQAANVTNAQNWAAIASVSNLTVTAQSTANAAVGGVTAVSNLVIGVKALNENAITNETDLIALRTYHYGSPDIVESPAGWFVFDGAGTITAFNWSAGRENVVIPWAIGGVPVTAIGDGAFIDTGTYFGFPVTSVIAPQTVTVIGSAAFANCFSLTSIDLRQATSIGESAFVYCSSLTSIDLRQATSIGESAFAYCSSLTSIDLPQATSIKFYAFTYCSSLTSIDLRQATSIGESAFSDCASLTSVHMGRNAPAEAAYVFEGITTPPTVYVTNPQATGWGAVWNGAPVVRPPLHGSNVTAQAYTLNGDTITEWPAGGGGATNITDGVTSGTYSEATRTLDISNLLAGVSMELPDGIVTNGQPGPVTLGSMTILANGNVGLEGNSTPGKPLEFASTTGEKIVLYKNGGYSLGVEGNEMRYNITSVSGRYTFNQGSYATPNELFRVGPTLGIHTPGYVGIGPTISGKQAHIFTDGTNCFFVNVNSVTNALTTN